MVPLRNVPFYTKRTKRSVMTALKGTLVPLVIKGNKIYPTKEPIVPLSIAQKGTMVPMFVNRNASMDLLTRKRNALDRKDRIILIYKYSCSY